LPQDWYLIARTPTGVHVWPVAADPAVRAEQVAAAQAGLGMPAVEDMFNDPRWDFQVSGGKPHPSVLTAATVHNTPPAA
jgi:hypothetical protein